MRLKGQVLYLSRGDLEGLALPNSEILKIVEDVFRKKGKGVSEMPPKVGIHPAAGASIHAMPALLPSIPAAGCKWVSDYDGNPARELPRLNGLLVMNDIDTGLPVSIMDCSWITEKRTGAATAVSAKYLARDSSSVVGIVGCGTQGWSNLEALVETLQSVESLRAYDTAKKKAQALVHRADTILGVEGYVAGSLRDAIRSADIVVTATPIQRNRRDSVRRTWLEEGCFYAALDYDSCWSGRALKAIDKFCTDDAAQLVRCQEEGFFQDIQTIYAELGEVVSGSKPGREDEVEKTMAMNLGIGLADVATGVRLYELALTEGVGTRLEL